MPGPPGVHPFEGCPQTPRTCTLGRHSHSQSCVTPVRPRGSTKGGKPMKRLCAVLSLVVLLSLAAMPALARADDPAPPPAEQSQPASDPVPDGWTWDESAPPASESPDGWTWDEG